MSVHRTANAATPRAEAAAGPAAGGSRQFHRPESGEEVTIVLGSFTHPANAPGGAGGLMLPFKELRREFETAVSVPDEGAADRLCCACVEMLEVDGASLSLLYNSETFGTFGASGDISRRLDEFQFTFGEGPCLDAMANSTPVLIPDLSQRAGERWPAFTSAVLTMGVRGIFAMPVMLDGTNVGALDLYRRAPGTLDGEQLTGGLLAADIAGGTIRALRARSTTWDVDVDDDGTIQNELALLGRVEVAQATGMIMGQLDIDRTEALIRLRGYAFAHGMTASEVAWDIVERRLSLLPDDVGGGMGGSTDGS
jgi:hypothetical protein